MCSAEEARVALEVEGMKDVMNKLFEEHFPSPLPDLQPGLWNPLFDALEKAHWAFLDHEENQNKFPMLRMKAMLLVMVQCVAALSPLQTTWNRFLSDLNKVRRATPVYGAILLNAALDKCIFVQSCGTGSWGFPKGKCLPEESPESCSMREVQEETGLILNPFVPCSKTITVRLHERHVTFFILSNIDETVPLAPMTKNEICSVEWKSLARMNRLGFQARLVKRQLLAWIGENI
jgi:8-oxo-dGTP pyrophosphatase MutT (NUDIX family)